MNVFELAAKLTLDTSAFDKGLSAVGGTIKKAGKTIGVALGAATAGVAALTKSAVSAYADYEQLVGGVETLFGNGGKNVRQLAQETGKSVREISAEYSSHERAQKRMLENADNAYKTAGLSANQYMETATSFAASLIASLGGDTEKAVDYTNRAVVQMADNANKMGTDIGAIQAAYQGFAKQNYTMLDNLKLGYGGTKTEMERLITDAEALDSSFKATRDSNGKLTMSYAEIVDAIQIVQDNMGITGTTAAEAEKTISGSLAMMKSSWENLLTAMASGEGFKTQMDALVSSASTALNNILPVVENFLVGFGDLMKQVGPIIVEKLPEIIEEVVPSMLDAAVQIVGALVEALPGILQAIVTVFGSLVDSISTYLNERWPEVGATFDSIVEFAKTAFNGIVDFIQKVFSGDWKGAWEDLKGLVTSIDWASVGTSIMTFVANAWNDLKKWASEKWEAAKSGLESVDWKQVGETVKTKVSEAWNALKKWAKEKWDKAVDGISSVDWKRAGEVAKTWIGAAWSTLREWAGKLWEKAKTGIQSVNWAEIGGKVKDAISGAWNALKGWATSLWNSAKAGIEDVNWGAVGATVLQWVEAAWSQLKTWATGLWDKARAGIEDVKWEALGTSIWNTIKTGLGSIAEKMKGFFDDAKTEIENIKWAQLGTDLWEWISGAFKSIAGDMRGFFSDGKSEVEGGIDWAGLGTSILEFILKAFMSLSTFLLNFFNAAWKDIKEIKWGDLGEKIRDFILDGLEELGNKMRGLGQEGYDGIAAIEWLKLGADILAHILYGLVMLPVSMVELARDGFAAIMGERQLAEDTGYQMKSAFMSNPAFGSLPENVKWAALEAIDGMAAQESGFGSAGKKLGNAVANGIKAGVELSQTYLRALQQAIDNMRGKTLTINVRNVVTNTSGGNDYTNPTRRASAMATGYIFREPTLFGYYKGVGQIAGDAGPEAVVGVYSLDNMIQNSVNAAVGRTQAAMVGVLSEILDKMPKGQLVLDTGALVGGIAPEMNDELERITAWSGGGRA